MVLLIFAGCRMNVFQACGLDQCNLYYPVKE